MTGAFSSFLDAAVRTATPLLLASLGELVVERAGIINIGLEGVIIAGAFGSLVGASHFGLAAGFATGALAGMAVTALVAVIVVQIGADQIIAGTAVTLLSLGLTGTLYRVLYGATGAALTIPTASPIRIFGLSSIPAVGPAVFAQPLPAYAAYIAIPLVWFGLSRTHWGLALRAIGEAPEAAISAGVPVARRRWTALLFGGAMGGLAGATLVLAQAGTFAEGMSAGRGFIAIAVVVLGRWQPGGVAIAALVFGAASALQFLLQALGLSLPYQLFLSVPYVLTLAGLAGAAGRARPPAALGRSLRKETAAV